MHTTNISTNSMKQTGQVPFWAPAHGVSCWNAPLKHFHFLSLSCSHGALSAFHSSSWIMIVGMNISRYISHHYTQNNTV